MIWRPPRSAERGLGDIERQGRLAEAAQLRNLHEIFKLLEVHGKEAFLSSRNR
jgi:hypothetical protein